jgi:uncharacterized protein YdeI (BOF family)
MKKLVTGMFPVVMALAFSTASVSSVTPAIAATPSSSTAAPEGSMEKSMEKVDRTKEKRANSQWRGGLPHTIEGQVLKIDGSTYTVRDSAGRELRIHVDQNTQSDSTIKVGDRVKARIGHVPTDVYARSFQKWTGKEAEAVLSPTIEGELLKREGDAFLIKDLTGQEVRLQIDKATKLDSNLTPGDKVVARVDNTMAPNYATSLTKKGRVGE